MASLIDGKVFENLRSWKVAGDCASVCDRLLDEDDWEVKTCALECLAALGRTRLIAIFARKLFDFGRTGSSVRIVGEHYWYFLNVCDMINFRGCCGVLRVLVGCRILLHIFATVVFCCSARSQSTWSSWEGPVGSLSDRSNTSCFDMFWSVLLLWLRDDSLIPNSGLTVLILNVLDMLQSKDSCKDFAHFVKLKRVSVYLGCFRQVYNWPPNHQSHHFLVLQDRRSSMRESCSADSLLSVAACLDFACVHRSCDIYVDTAHQPSGKFCMCLLWLFKL